MGKAITKYLFKVDMSKFSRNSKVKSAITTPQALMKAVDGKFCCQKDNVTILVFYV